LGYLSKASCNSKLIAESSLKYPFVECLERHSINDVHLEFSHPLFKGKRIDAYIGGIKDDDTINDKSPQMFFVEFKFVRGNALSENVQQLYFNDILRLHYLKYNYPQSQCFFVICGETISFNDAFRYEPKKLEDKVIWEDRKGSKRIKRKSIYNNWLSFVEKTGVKTANLTDKAYTKFVSSFKEDYLSKTKEGVSLERQEVSTITTQLKLLLPSKGSIDNSYSLGLWEILKTIN
jgi:hypothetical protein